MSLCCALTAEKFGKVKIIQTHEFISTLIHIIQTLIFVNLSAEKLQKAEIFFHTQICTNLRQVAMNMCVYDLCVLCAPMSAYICALMYIFQKLQDVYVHMRRVHTISI